MAASTARAPKKPILVEPPEAVVSVLEANPEAFEQALTVFRDGIGNPTRARRLAAGLLPGLEASELWWVERYARGEVTDVPFVAPRRAPDALAEPEATPATDDVVVALARDLVERALRVGDARGAELAGRVVKLLTSIPRRDVDAGELDLTRLTERELSCLEYLCDLARGRRPAENEWSKMLADPPA
jgi:hypothetical protein